MNKEELIDFLKSNLKVELEITQDDTDWLHPYANSNLNVRLFLLDEEENSDKYKAFMDEDGTFGWRELVKHLNGLGLNLKETEVRDLLKDKNIICKQGNKYVPSQSGVREGYGVIKDNIVNGINRPKSRYTVKLRDYLLNLFKGVA